MENMDKKEPKFPRNCLKWLLIGTALGVILLAVTAEAMKYTDSRPFCTSCHVMSEAALTLSQSQHANLPCNYCHAPQNLIEKIPFKAKEGIHDIVSNMQGNEPAIRAKLETREVVNANCIRCHGVTNSDVDIMASKPYCTDCHKTVAHTTKKPISTRMAADE